MTDHVAAAGPARPLILTDAGIETVLADEGLDLPCFAAFPLIDTAPGRSALQLYYLPFLDLARELGTPFVLGTPTWRANPDWGRELGYDSAALAGVNQRCVTFVDELRRSARDSNHGDGDGPTVLLEGVVGPRSDDVEPGGAMSADQAEKYHCAQLSTLADAGVDQFAAMTIADAAEAVGIVRAARSLGVPVTVGFTLGDDGRLPSGQTLGDAIEQVDRETDGGATGFMINCSHPSHFTEMLAGGGRWRDRIVALRANASATDHDADTADTSEEPGGDTPAALAAHYLTLRELLPNLTTVGGCCGTDVRHVAAIGRAWIG
jgi:homocysteine S-methyltransferase